jgi:signal transduction histidine kinase
VFEGHDPDGRPWKTLRRSSSPYFRLRLFKEPEPPLAYEAAAELPAQAPAAELRALLERFSARSGAAVALFDSDRRPLAQAGRPLPPPRRRHADSHWMTRARDEGGGRSAEEPLPERPPQLFALRLDDGRWLVVGRDLRPRRPPFGPAAWLGLLALGTGLGAYPVARRLTRRLERLQRGVEDLGRGDLRARVPVEGRDEVAQLAASFNIAAARIEQLMQSHRALLANASHELRSPLARVRVALEMLRAERTAGERQALHEEVQRDVAELDRLIDEILLASRLDAQAADGMPLPQFELLDLTALAAEECARFGAAIEGEAVRVAGDARLLRRLVRNLLQNARRHAPGTAIEVAVRATAGEAVLTVADRGPGVAEHERRRIFEPFYRAQGGADSAGGVGLGLALVARIARRHRGDVECLPREGGGSVFRVALPLVAA